MTVSAQRLAEIIAQLGTVRVVEPTEPGPMEPPASAPPQNSDRIRLNLAEPLEDTIKRIVAIADAQSERSQQTAIGFSELGNPCDRYLAFKAVGVEAVNTGLDNWLAIVGTACHAWLEKAYAAENARLGRTRFVIEETVYALPNLYGHGDLYDADLAAVVDHKILGVTKLKKIKAGEISPTYRTQLHCYGYGHAQAGRPVREVILAVYPRNDSLRGDYGGHGLHLHREPYDEQIARRAIDRWLKVVEYAFTLEVDRHPDRWPLIPAAPGDDCRYCPFFRPNGGPADATGCPGKPVSIPTTMPGLTA